MVPKATVVAMLMPQRQWAEGGDRGRTVPGIVTSALDDFDQRDYYQAIDRAMVIDVSSHIQIRRPRDEVGAYALNLDNADKWVANLSSLEWITPPPLAVRSRISLVTELFGHRLKAAYEIVSLAPAERLVMRAERPFPIEVRYTLESITTASTHMAVRGRADPGGLLRLLTPMIADELRESYRGDLLRLKRILESERSGSAAY
jgi:hypothetical protein